MKRLGSIFFYILLFTALFYTQKLYDAQKGKSTYFEPQVLSPEVVRASDLGLHNAAADLQWLAAIQYFGGNQSRTYEKLDEYLFLSAELDPKFAYPYAFGALILPAHKETDKALLLGQKGIDNGVLDWRIPYHMAVTYHLVKEDTRNAAKYFDLAANTPGAPDNIKTIAANYGSRSDIREKTKQIWIGLYENSKDEVVQERAKAYIIHFEILDLVDNSIKSYEKIYGKAPEKIEDLVTGKILKEIPPDPFGLTLIIENGKAAATLSK